MRNWKRLISVVLALVLVSTMFTGLALAADDEVIIPFKSIKVTDAFKEDLKEPLEVGNTGSWRNMSNFDTEYDEPSERDPEKTYRYETVYNLIFSTSSDSVLRINKSGSYTARGAGKATITVSSQNNPAASATFEVEVKAKPVVTKLSFSSSSFEVKYEDPSLSLEQYATIEPKNVSSDSYTVTSQSSDPEIVSASGWYVSGLKAGTATVTFTITNKADSSKVTATATITVTEKALTALSFSKSSITINKAEKSYVDLWQYLTKTPQNADRPNLKWESSNEQVASVSGGSVWVDRPGTATITVKSITNPEIQASIDIIVIESEGITEVKFDENTIVLYFVEKAGKLYDAANSQRVKLNIQPASAASTIKTVTWTTSNAKVAIPQGYKENIYDEYGSLVGKEYGVDVSAVGKGSCTISVYFKDNNGKEYSGSFRVKVKEKSPTAKLNKKSITLKVKKSFKLSAKDADKKTALKGKWKSSDKKVAKVNSKGKVTAVNPGRAVITFTPKNKAMKKVTCVVTVTK